jgi:hypothetical protein
MCNTRKMVGLWLLLILTFAGIYQLASPASFAGEKIPFSSFMREVQNSPDHIKGVRVHGEHWRGVFAGGRAFHTYGPAGIEVLQRLDDAEVPYEIDEADDASQWPLWLLAAVPMLAMAFGLGFALRRLQRPAGAFEYGALKNAIEQLLVENVELKARLQKLEEGRPLK